MQEYSPLTLSEVLCYVDLCKNVSRDHAEVMQKFLLRRALGTGVTSSEIMEAIQSITDRFIEEEREMRRKLMAEEMLRRGLTTRQTIDATDDEIVKAIKKTLSKFLSDRDWAGIYRILVDCCDFPTKLSDFVKRFDQMGIYPSDDVVKGIRRCGIPAISEYEYKGHKFSYQALQKGLSQFWPKTYWEWLNNNCTDRDFINRRNIATAFFNNLKAEAGA